MGSAAVVDPNMDRIARISSTIRVIPDFPKAGIMFQDITTLLLNPEAFKDTIDLLVERYKDKNISVVAGIEARGFIFGPPVALAIGAKFVPLRKPGKLPWKVISEEYSLEYGTDKMEMHVSAVEEGERAIVIDDLIATGGTLAAAINLVERVGAIVVECACVIELPELNGRDRLGDRPLFVLVAVIGAGVAGLLAGRDLREEGHQVVIFEKSDQIGGTWVYDPRVDSDPIGLDPDREIVHGSSYESMRTNVPDSLMGISDYPFGNQANGRIFPGHEEVLKFIQDFASDFGLGELIRFGTEVIRAERVDSVKSEWEIESRSRQLGSVIEVYDAVVICNGHYTEPRLASISGIEKWRRKQIHSHNYRVPEPFRDQIVVVIGSGPSAIDITKEIASVAKQVHLSSRAPNIQVSKLPNYDNMWQHSKISCVDEDGTVTFEDGFSIETDIIFYCTGYKFYYPFLRTNGIVNVIDNRVGPLYKHVFPPQLAPNLSFIGLPSRTIVFRMMELQTKWVAKILSGKLVLPSKEEMMIDIEMYYHHMKESGFAQHHTHSLNFKLDYLEWLADLVGLPLEDPTKEIANDYFNKVIFQRQNRDSWVPFVSTTK